VALKLPLTVITKLDVLRLVRETVALNEYMMQASLRSGGTPMQQLPKLSRLLDDTARANGVNLLDAEHRRLLQAALEELKAHAPIMHISFAAEPSAAFLTQIITWLRMNVHPDLIIQVGLQPQIAAGCIVRSENKLFDLSLRANFTSKREQLAAMLGGRQ
jgi:F0F1-type ATP synthase delta subunit